MGILGLFFLCTGLGFSLTGFVLVITFFLFLLGLCGVGLVGVFHIKFDPYNNY